MSIGVLIDHAKASGRPAIHLASPAKLLLLISVVCIFVPLAMLGLSFATGGLVVSSILFVYVFSVLLNVPLLLACMIICAGALALRQLKHFA